MEYIKKINHTFLIIIALFIGGFFFKSNKFFYQRILSPITQILKKKTHTFSTLYDNFEIQEDVTRDALNTEALTRMQHIDQGGPLAYFGLCPFFSRYDHCVGVWSLIRKFNGSLNEQLTGLFHDISHTAFSHIADKVFEEEDNDYTNHSYQDSIHLWFLKRSSIDNFCIKHKINIDLLDPENPIYTMLEADLPEMCADRIEYNLHTAYVYKLHTKEEIQDIISHLHYEVVSYTDTKGNTQTNKKWYFDDIIYAKKFAVLPLYFIKSIWNAAYNMVFYKIFSHLIKYALNKSYIKKDDFIFGTDKQILDILYTTNDPLILNSIDILNNIFNHFDVISNGEEYDEILKGKFRGINPLVKTENMVSAKHLTELDLDFNYFYNSIKREVEIGYKIKYNKKIHDLGIKQK